MLESWVVVLASFGYIALLFAIAFYADRRKREGRSVIASPVIYSLSLAVYATAWTFYGSVGRAAHDGVGFLPIYIGPTLTIVLWWFVLRKMLRVAKQGRITSLADFIASRYGKSALLGGLVTVIAVIGILPYISLQLKAVASSFQIVFQYPELVMPQETGSMPVLETGTMPILKVTAFYVAMFMALFTIAFGTRHLDVSERHEGMVAAIAFESLVKLCAFLAVGLFVTYGVHSGFADVFTRAAADPKMAPMLTPFDGVGGTYGTWAALIALSMGAIMFLPRQFQVTVIENVDEAHLRKAAWLLPVYMLAINLFVLPIAFAGLLHFSGGGVDGDTFVLTLPMAYRQEALALFVFIGGLSAATGMVIVETIALSTMVCNDLVMPVLLRLRTLRLNERADLTALLLTIRRCAIVAILLLGYLYFRAAGEAYALVSIGLISFAAVAQFAPATLGGIYWKGGTRAGAVCGLVAGFVVWAYTLLIPAFARSHWLPESLLGAGPFGIELLRPVALLGLTGLDPVAHALLWSMIANAGCYIGVSLFTRHDAAELRQASLFVDVFERVAERAPLWQGSAEVASLRALLARFLGPAEAEAILADYARDHGVAADAIDADAALVHHVERKLAGALGGASAHIMIASVVKEEALSLEEVRAMLDEASQIVVYSHRLEQKSRELERATQELSEANERLKELDRLKDDFISTVSHELRTPLTSIRAFSEILHDNPALSDEERTRYLKIVIKETERLTRLINQILDTSRLESGKLQWHVSEFDLKEVIEQAAAAMDPLFREKEVRLGTRLPDEAPRVTADLDRIVQVLLNLLSNALKFCERGKGRVEIVLAEEQGAIRVDVRDNGCGIAPEDQRVLFEKFRQGGDALTAGPGGSGLGLHISRHIVERFGGRMWVTSAPAQGACFSFTLPLTAPALAGTAA